MLFRFNKNIFNVFGQSILELIVALGVFMIIAASFTSFIFGNLLSLERGSDYVQAEGLLGEGVEAIRSIKTRAWNELLYSTSSVSVVAGKWTLDGEGGSESIGKFTRYISFYPVYRNISKEVTAIGDEDILSKRMRVFVAWESSDGVESVLTRNSYISAWNSKKWTQTDWFGGSGQSVWIDSSMYDSDDGNIDISVGGQVSLLEIATSTYAGSGYFISSAFDTGDSSSFAALFWTENMPVGCDIKFQIKTAQDVGGFPGSWSSSWSGPEGEDGDETDYYTTSDGELIHTDHNTDQWIKYKVILSGDGSDTPVLSDVVFYYQ